MIKAHKTLECFYSITYLFILSCNGTGHGGINQNKIRLSINNKNNNKNNNNNNNNNLLAVHG